MPTSDQPGTNPQASRPHMPDYGLLPAEQGRGLLPWEWAAERLAQARNYWVATTRPDGRPHLTAIWAIWWQDSLWFSTAPHARKARNLARNPGCAVSAESGVEAVTIEGQAELVSDRQLVEQVERLYVEKYGEGFPGESHVYRLQPQVAFAFIATKEFEGSATRWRFTP
jgi:PPOX class probable F420-dependent enzyme